MARDHGARPVEDDPGEPVVVVADPLELLEGSELPVALMMATRSLLTDAGAAALLVGSTVLVAAPCRTVCVTVTVW